MRTLLALALSLSAFPALAEQSYFEGEVSLRIHTQLDSRAFREQSGIEATYIPPFPRVEAASFCEAIQVAKRDHMNKPFAKPLRAILCSDDKMKAMESDNKGSDCIGRIENGKLYSSSGAPLETPALDITVDGLILKEVTATKWIRSCIIGRKWHPLRKADISCDAVKCP